MRKNHSIMRKFAAFAAMAMAASPTIKERVDPRSSAVIPAMKRDKKGKWVAAKR